MSRTFHTLDSKVMSFVPRVLSALEASKAHTSVKYLSDKLVIRATRLMYGPVGKRHIPAGHDLHVVLTIGKPNYIQRTFIKMCKKSGEPFPVKKIQLKFASKKK